jgi:hypothetical protein
MNTGAPTLLIAFCAGTLGMVLAVVLLLRGAHDWDDFAAIAVLFAVAAALFGMLMRALAQDEPPSEDEDDVPPAQA